MLGYLKFTEYQYMYVSGHMYIAFFFEWKSWGPEEEIVDHTWEWLKLLAERRPESLVMMRGTVSLRSWKERLSSQWHPSCTATRSELSFSLWQFLCSGTPLVAQMVKNLPALQETWVRSLDQEDPLEEGMATHSCILAWRIPWTEEPGGL